MNSPILLFDTSYCCFYRYHALCNWFKLAHPDSEFDCNNVKENTVFMEKFYKKFLDMVSDYIKKYNPEQIIMAMDGCKNWRKEIYTEYKANRKNSNAKISDVQIFIYLQDTIITDLCKLYNNLHCIKEDKAEGDDVIAVIKKHIRKNEPDKKIIIITSDTDLCQLIDENTTILDLKNKCLNNSVLEKNNITSDYYLAEKCLIGDTSDNIPKVFPRCGKKTIQKYLNDPDLLNNQLQISEEYRNQYNLNKLLIDLENIPDEIKNDILSKYLQIGDE
tara:strand:+ start:75 stop:899 length:825 start_codon:yes stop_codon:yes gene_type:complete